MPLPVQNAESSRALTAALGLKGRFRLSLDEIIVPVAVTDFLPDTPYTSIVPISGSTSQVAVALEFSYIMIQAVAGSILVVDQVLIDNQSGGDASYQFRLLTAGEVAAVSVAAFNTSLNLNSPIIGGLVARSGALVSRGTHTALVGTIAGRINILAGMTERFKFPSGASSYGDDSEGPVAITFFDTTVNQPMAATFFGRQFLNKG